MATTTTSARNLSKFCQMPISRHLAPRLPFGFSQRLVALLGRLYYWRHPQERALICEAVNRVLARPSPLRRNFYRRVFDGIYEHYQEKLFLAYAPETRVKHFLGSRLVIRGGEALESALATGLGVILVTGHFGAVEFLPAALGLQGYPAAVIVRPQTPELAASMTRRAALVNLTVIIPEQGKVLPAALRALREGRVLITEMDEFEMWRHHQEHPVDFLGFSLPGDRTLDVLQKRSGAPVLTGLVHRQPHRRYALNIGAEITRQNPASVGQQCLRRLEQAIWSTPEQWYQWKEFGKVLATLPVRELPASVPQGTAAQPPLAPLAHVWGWN